MKKRLIILGMILAMATSTGCGSKAGNADGQKQTADEPGSQKEKDSENKSDKVIKVKSDSVKTDYEYPGTKSGFIMLDYFAKEKGKTKQDTTMAHLGKIKDIDADKIISIINESGQYDKAYLEQSDTSSKIDGDPVEDLGDWPTIDTERYESDTENASTVKGQIEDDMWSLLASDVCFKENGMEDSGMWNDSAVYYSDRKTPYINSDKELTTEEIDQTAKVFGKPTGATLYTTKPDENGVSYQFYVYWKIGDNVAGIEYYGTTGKKSDQGADIQTISAFPCRISSEKSYKENIAYQDRTNEEYHNHDKTYKFIFK